MLKTALMGLLASALLAGCSYPVETAHTADTRPQVTFKTQHDASEMVLYIDGESMGTVNDYLAGKATLHIESGTHELKVRLPNGRVHIERLYVADGVTKTVVIQ